MFIFSANVVFLMLVLLVHECTSFLHGNANQYQVNDEDRLWMSLMKDGRYNSKVRPVYNVSHIVTVTIDIAVKQVIDFDEPKMVIRSGTWMRVYWRDELLTWNATDYNGLASLLIPANDVWLPDLTLFTSVVDHPGGIFGNKHVLVSVTCHGDVTWLFPTVIESQCGVDMTLFPFDTQKCEHEFGSWSYDGLKVDMHPKNNKGDVDNFIDNGEWEMVDMPSSRHVKLYKCCLEPFPSVIYTYTLRRRPTFYVMNMIMPCFIITIVNLFSFLLPVESGEKITFNITTLLAMVVFLRIITEYIPPQAGAVAVIEWYFGLCIVTLCLSTIVGVFVIRMHFAGVAQKPFPAWARKIVNGRLGQLLGCSKSALPTSDTDSLEESKVIQVKTYDDRKSSYSNSARVVPLYLQNSRATQTLNLDYKTDRDFFNTVNFTSGVKTIEQNASISGQDWKNCASFVDKCFFIVFLISSVSIFGYIFSLLNN